MSETGNAAQPAVDLELVDRALEAAKNGEGGQVLEYLFRSRLMDGLVRHVLNRYPGLDPDEAHTAVSEAIDEFCLAARKGQTLRNPKAWLFKVTLIKAYRLSTRKSNEAPIEGLDWQISEGDLDGSKSAEREELIKKALSIARFYLPLLGQENVRKVMEFHFDAVERGVQSLEHAEISEALGLTEDTVRQCSFRGFKRLKRIAEEKGVNLNGAIPDDDTNSEEGDNHE